MPDVYEFSFETTPGQFSPWAGVESLPEEIREQNRFGEFGSFPHQGVRYHYRIRPVRWSSWGELQEKLAALPAPEGLAGRWVVRPPDWHTPLPLSAEFWVPVTDSMPGAHRVMAYQPLELVLPQWVKDRPISGPFRERRWSAGPEGYSLWAVWYTHHPENDYEESYTEWHEELRLPYRS